MAPSLSRKSTLRPGLGHRAITRRRRKMFNVPASGPRPRLSTGCPTAGPISDTVPVQFHQEYVPGAVVYCDTLMSYNSLLEGLLTKLHAMSCIYSNNVWFSLFVSNFLLNKIILCILELSVCVFLSSCFIQTSLTLSSFLELHGRGSIIIITMQAVRNQENRRPSERRWL